jgi:hypothetical protein
MHAPDMLDGMRAPRSVRLEDIQTRAHAGNPLPEPEERAGVTTYVSKWRRYRIQITAPTAFTNPVTGQHSVAGREIAAEFDEHVYRNREKDPDIRKLIDDTLQRNPYFGTFGKHQGDNVHFWLAEDQKAATQAAKIAAALETLKALPKDAVDAFVADLQQGDAADHVLPSPTVEPAKQSLRPIK